MRRTTLADGRAVVVKPGDATAEAAGLRWLRVAGGPPVAEVVEVGPERLVVAWVEQTPPTPAAARRFGRELAALHAAGAPAFGAPPPGGRTDASIGAAPMRNAPAPAWPTWYVADRVLPYLRSARDGGGIDAAAHGGHRETDLAMLELFGCAHLDQVLGAYAEVAPTAGRRARMPLHQLFPLLVHAVLFGGGYGRQAGAAARAALSS